MNVTLLEWQVHDGDSRPHGSPPVTSEIPVHDPVRLQPVVLEARLAALFGMKARSFLRRSV